MSTPVISIENLGKKYTIKTNAGLKNGNETFRDFLTNKAKNIFSKRSLFDQRSENFWALKNLDVEIGKGERLAILGHNGAGKSTLLKIISRVTEPTTGKLKINGSISSLLEVGTGFHPELTGKENIFLNGSILGMTKRDIQRKFDEIVEFAGIERFLEVPIKRYSSGMSARLGFAIAAHLESDIMIVDEVLAVGDANFQRKCIGKMDDVSKSNGKTILFVSHNISVVKQLCNKALVLDKGELKFSGPTMPAITHYTSILNTELEFKTVKCEPFIKFLQFKTMNNVKHNEDWTFTFDFYSEKDIEDCYFDFGVYNREILPLTHTISSKTLKSFKIKKGYFTIQTTLENVNLNAGNYLVGIYLATYSGKVLFEALEIPAAEVVEVPEYVGASAVISVKNHISIKQNNRSEIFL